MAETMKYLGITRNTVLARVKDDTLRPIRLGRLNRFRWSDLLALGEPDDQAERHARAGAADTTANA